MSDTDVFGSKGKLRWYHYIIHLGYYVPYWIKFFFGEPFKEPKKDLNILDIVKTLLDSETTQENLDKCRELTKLHRVVENTKARRRLEKWSLRVIATYLLVMLLIVFCCYTDLPLLRDGHFTFSIPDTIMVTLLSTTTINIIGLGLIVLRGHFLANDKTNKMDDDNNQ